MNYRIITLEHGATAVRMEDDTVVISNEKSALGVFMTISYETGKDIFIINKENLSEEFFDLSNKIAGAILQKLINYRMKLAVIGDFSKYNSKALKDFIYECNSGKDIFFAESEFEALRMLSKR